MLKNFLQRCKLLDNYNFLYKVKYIQHYQYFSELVLLEVINVNNCLTFTGLVKTAQMTIKNLVEPKISYSVKTLKQFTKIFKISLRKFCVSYFTDTNPSYK